MHKTPLYQEHINLGAKMVDFAGWSMPLNYGSQIEEHQYVRQHAGIFDVSHMNIVDVKGADAKVFLRYVLANDVNKLIIGKALYTCMLTPQGGVIDDLIVYFMDENNYRLVLNAGTREKDLHWLHEQAAAFQVVLQAHQDLAIIALQGPASGDIAEAVFSGDYADQLGLLKPFHFIDNQKIMVARTGYTGEEGFEIILPASDVVSFWHNLLDAGAKPIGLGARDSLRLEAGFNLYGSDMDETTSPLESNLAWTIAWEPTDRDFIGREALMAEKQRGVARHLVGLILEARGVLRHDQIVLLNNKPIGKITSGGFSPTLGLSIAMARVDVANLTACDVDIRGKLFPVKVVKPNFRRKS